MNCGFGMKCVYPFGIWIGVVIIICPLIREVSNHFIWKPCMFPMTTLSLAVFINEKAKAILFKWLRHHYSLNQQGSWACIHLISLSSTVWFQLWDNYNFKYSCVYRVIHENVPWVSCERILGLDLNRSGFEFLPLTYKICNLGRITLFVWISVTSS